MLCARPSRLANGQVVGCGKCLNCTINRRRGWTARMLLEGIACEKVAFQEVSWVTMTYADENLPFAHRGPDGESVGTLSHRDYQLLFKRMRNTKTGLGSFRFCLVGEYGERTGRPHYHALVYGPRVCDVESFLQRTWEKDFGHTRTRPWAVPDPGFAGQPGFQVKQKRAAYCAHYVTKKLSAPDSAGLRRELTPEFWRVSRNPGIGCTPATLELMTSKGASHLIAETGDVPRTVRIGGKIWPLDKNIRAWLRKELGIPATREEREALTGVREPDRQEPTPEDYQRAKEVHDKLMRRAASRARQL